MSTTALVITVVAMGLVTYLIRLVPIALFTRLKLPVWTQQTMRYVPTAVLAAIIVPELILPNGTLDISPGNARLVAGLVAIVVAWRTRNVLLTVVVGMVVVWVMALL